MGKGHPKPPRASSRARGSDHRQRQRLWALACAVGVAVIGVGVALLAKSNVSLSKHPVVPMQRPPNLKKSRTKASAAQPATPPPPPKKSGKKCRDADPSCSSWAGAGECDANPGFMLDSCPLSCNACPAGDEDPACVRRNSTPAVQDRGIAAVFERALREYPQYKPRALSRDPWVMTFDDFLSEEETERIIELCSSSFERSLAGDQLSPVRTSHQCWCQVPPCVNDPVVQRISERISGLTMTPQTNAEYMQVVRYEVGQFYKIHHDQNSAPFTPQGARLYTFFMYLNTPDAGGGTRFNDLGITVAAKRGSAVLWPSLLDSNVELPDLQTHHEALPVEAGIKFGANLWIHQYDFKTPSSRRCELTFKNSYDPESMLPRYVEARARDGVPREAQVPLSMADDPRNPHRAH